MKVAGWTVLLLAALSWLGQLLWPLGLPGRAVDVAPLPSPTPVPYEDGRSLPTREEAVVVDAPGGRLSGLVIEPSASGPHRPALVLVAGAGPARAADLVVAGRALAAQGLIVLVYDKRTAGYSPVHRDYTALAEDARAALAAVRARPGVAVDQVGLLGISEGGWVVPIAAAPSPGSSGPAFVVLVSAPVVSPGEQVQWILDSGLAAQRAPLGAREALAAAQATNLPGGLLSYTRHVPEPALNAIQVPVLALYGTQDAAIPVVDSAERLLAATGPATTAWMLA
ncbi:MAG: alpha/beta hydrolase family protein, partial [Pseudonocardiaceae bacterium]